MSSQNDASTQNDTASPSSTTNTNALQNTTSRNENDDAACNGTKLNQSTNLEKFSAKIDPNNIILFWKRVRDILNSVTLAWNRGDIQLKPWLQEFQTLTIDTDAKRLGVVSLIQEKVIEDLNCSAICAQLCRELSNQMAEESDECKSDRKSRTSREKFEEELLNKFLTEFNNHVANEDSMREKLKPILDELVEAHDLNQKIECTKLLDKEQKNLRRRSIGTVRFIGELYRQNMLLTSIMEWCVMTLLRIPTDEKLECLCELLNVAGEKMEQNTNDDDYDKKYSRDLTPHFQTMQQIASDKKQNKISNRVRTMLMDLIELRKNKWVPRRADSNPKKIGQILKDAQEEQYSKQIQMLASMPSNTGMGNSNLRKDCRSRDDGHGNMSRGGSMSGSGHNNNNKMNRGTYQDNDGWTQAGGNKNRGGNSSHTQIDPSKFRAPQNTEDLTKTLLGEPNQRGIRSNNKLNHQSLSSSTTSLSTSNLPSSSSLTPSSSDPKISEDLSEDAEKQINKMLKSLLQNVQKNDIKRYSDLDDAPELEKIHKAHRWVLARELHNMALDISGLTVEKRFFIGTICVDWHHHKLITKTDYVKGLSDFIKSLEDLVFDVPKVYEWTAQMISQAFFHDIITLNDLKNTAKESRAKILEKLLPFMAYEYGPQYVRDLWKRSDCKWEQFTDDNVDQHLEKYKLKFVQNANETLPPASEKIPNDRFRQRIYDLIRKGNFSEKEIDEYIEIHVPTINKQSIRLLTKTLIQALVSKTKMEWKLDENLLARSIDILKIYIGDEKKQELQLESLYAIQLLSNELEHPSGFLHKVFSKLYNEGVVPSTVFKNWETSTSEPRGKGVAVKNLTNFLKSCEEDSCDSDDEEQK